MNRIHDANACGQKKLSPFACGQLKLSTLKRSRFMVILALKHSRFGAETLPHSIYTCNTYKKEPVVRSHYLWISPISFPDSQRGQ